MVLLYGLAVLATAVTAFRFGLLLALVVGVLCVAVVWVAHVLATRERPHDEGRRRVLALGGLAGLALATGGAELGRLVRRWSRADPEPVVADMAKGLGSEALDFLRRGHYPGHSGELQLVVAPFSSSNYPQESTSLVRRDPRTSHAALWPYLERVPIVLHAPGIVRGYDTYEDRVTLADLAPTTARLMGFDFPAPDGVPLPGAPEPESPPKVIVTLVIDGGGWNVLQEWSDRWPNLRKLMASEGTLVFSNAVMGSFPSVTACAHATIGTGAYPWKHGISGHNVRVGRNVVKAYGEPGRADPAAFLKAPTLAEAWSDETDDGAWIGEIGYQVWHLGMIGRGGTMPLGDKPVAIYWNDDGQGSWQPQNPELYRLPGGMPTREELTQKVQAFFSADEAALIDKGGIKICCSPPIVEQQGDVLQAVFANEPIGESGSVDLLYINFKSPDYTGHVVNMLHEDEGTVLAAVDAEIGRLVQTLEQRFSPGEYALVITADHGQCPLPDEVGGVRLDPIQLESDLNREFGTSVFKLIDYVAPSEVFLNERALADADLRLEDLAAFLRDYRYGDNIGNYVPRSAVEWSHLDDREFAAVMPVTFLQRLTDAAVSAAGAGRYVHIPGVEPGPPNPVWMESIGPASS
jgi:hypothetical protein